MQRIFNLYTTGAFVKFLYCRGKNKLREKFLNKKSCLTTNFHIGFLQNLLRQKNFYSLGGASAAVLLTCWAINYVAVDVSWLTYKVYRLIAIILSETFAVAIMFQSADRKPVQWLFAFLNGLLIFVNASGLNVMTSSYIFNPKNPDELKPVSFYHFQKFSSEKNMHAGIFPLPRMMNWMKNSLYKNKN